jgi:hypothetical protein
MSTNNLQPNYNSGISPGAPGQPASMSGWDVDTKLCETAAGIGFGLAVSQVATVGAAATGTLTQVTAAPANGETVTIGGKVYTFQTVLTNLDGNVLIGASIATAMANLAAAINLAAGAGTTYAAATTLHPTVSAVGGASTVVLTAKSDGVAGNSIDTTETLTNGSFGGAVLSGGVDLETASVHDRAVTLGGAAFIGISTKDVTLVSVNADKYPQNANMGVMVRGDIWVQVLTNTNVGDAVKYNTTTGQLGDSAGTTIANAAWKTAAAAGGMAIVRLNMP